MKGARERLLLSFYGDDFTGSTAVMEVLGGAGLRTVLFLAPPTPEQLARYEDLRCVGVAGMTRAMRTDELERELPGAFEALGALGAEIFHYKVCSTFDSSPEVGSIGRAIDIGQRRFASPFVPLVVAAPAVGRYCLFGNLFATVAGETYRLDRHPVMSRHPVTPMDEGDLRVHLGRQTARSCALMDLLALTGAPEEVEGRFAALLKGKPDIVLFDVLDESRLAAAGRLIWQSRRADGRPLFTVGSQGLEYALVAHFREAGLVSAARPPMAPAPVPQLLVVSGSCSQITGGQIAHGLRNGFVGVEADAARLVDPAAREIARDEAVRGALEALRAGRDVIIHSARGPEDARISSARAAAAKRGDVGRLIGEELGRIARAVIAQHRLRRVVLAGGDTSGHSARALGIEALELAAPGTVGSPLCRAHAPGQPIDGVELALKGGQMGGEDFFERLKSGKL